MAVSAEQLNIILSARDKEFSKAMDRSQKRVERFASKSQKSLGKTSKNFDLLAGAARKLAPLLAAAFSVSAVSNMVQGAAQIQNLSNVAGVTTQSFQELAFASGQFGVNQEKLSDILKDVNDKFGDYAATGAGPLADFFENIAPKIGLTADEFASLSSEQKLGRYVSALEDANVSQAEMTFYMEALASDATLLSGVFANNGAELSRLSQEIREAGGVMDQELISKAVDAREELSAAGKVINAQLSVALAELIPLLVTGAEGFAALVKNIVGAIQAVQNFVDPQTDLEIATDNVVAAMGDEIRQSQQLDIALGRSTTISAEAARQKLQEAMARQENAKAAIDEQKAIALGSDAYQSLIDQIEASQDAARSISAAPDTLVSPSKIAAYEAAQQRLVELRNEQARMLTTDQELTDQFERTTANIAELEEALANASNGMVTFGEDMASPIEASDRLSASASSASASTDELLANLATASPALQQLGFNAQFLESAMSGVESSMESAFMSMVDGTQTASEAFKGMASEIIKELYRILVVKQITGLITSFASSALGGAPQGPTMSGAPLGRFSNVSAPGLASGGSVQAGKSYMTGEHGRELFVPQVNGRILSAGQTNNAMSAGGGGVTVIQNNTFGSGVSRAEVNAMLPKMVEATKAAVADAKLRGGSYGRSFA